MNENNKFIALYNGINSILSSTSFYPASVIENGVEIKRDPYGNGYNDGKKIIYDQLCDLLEKVELDNFNIDLQLLLLTDVGWISSEDNKFYLNMNDTFYYACADAEEVPEDQISEVAKLFRRYGYPGLIYWVSEKRNEMPKIKKYCEDVEYVKSKEKKC